MIRWLRSMPLRWRLPAITGALVVLALALSGTAVMALMRNSLVDQLDAQLHEAAVEGIKVRDDVATGPYDDAGPADYYVSVVHTDGSEAVLMRPTMSLASEPKVPALDQLATGTPVTVGSVDADGPRWRVATYTAHRDGEVVGTAVIAIPMTSVEKTSASMVRSMVLGGAAVTILAVLLGYVAVQRSLRPLLDIERAAHEVATGDLSRRASLQPPTTEVGRLGLSFNAMVAGLENAFEERRRSEERVRRFVSDASHELRTPLASIRGYGELYRMGAVPPDEVASTMGRIEAEARRMGGLVNDLLSLARLDEGRGLAISDVDLVAIARDGGADLHALDPSREVEVIAPEPVRIPADADRVRQVMTNLIGNVVQHTPAGSPVEIAVTARTEGGRGWATLEVRDHGPGISAEDSERVFERFFRPDTSRTRASGGSGLGLAIVATIVAAHGGTVRHSDTRGGGATITMTLPGPDRRPESD